MRITYLKWGYSHDEAIINAFRNEGIYITDLTIPENLLIRGNTEGCNEQWLAEWKKFKSAILSLESDILFTINFFDFLSDLCLKEMIPYCCWVLQLPDFDLYHKAVYNPCNYIGICDSYLVEKMQKIGLSKVFFLPDAIDLLDGEENEPLYRELCFVESTPSVQLDQTGMSLYGKGYLDAFLHAQRVLYGAYILENGMISRVQREFEDTHLIPSSIRDEFHQLYLADEYLAPVCTRMQQEILVQNFDTLITIYSNGAFSNCDSVKYPYEENEEKRRKIYSEKEFSLVLAPHILHNGIPRTALEVIAAGGFPLCGFQKDYAYFFKNNESIAFFSSISEFRRAIVKYGNNPDERERIRRASYKLVKEQHTYKQRIISMLNIWNSI